MTPSFSCKNGVRYRFYVSTALRRRNDKVGSVARVSASEIESLVEAEILKRLELDDATHEAVFEHIQQVSIASGKVQIALANPKRSKRPFEIPWSPNPKFPAQIQHLSNSREPDPKLIRAIARAHSWLDQLSTGQKSSIEELAAATNFNPKVIRLGLRLAFLATDLTVAAATGGATFKLQHIPKVLPLSWREQRRSVE